MEFRSDSLDFSQALSGSGPRSSSKTVVFPRAVRSATAGLARYVVEFSNNDIIMWAGLIFDLKRLF